MRIVHVLPSRDTAYGGPVRVAESLGRAARAAGHAVDILPSRPAPPVRVLGTLVYWPGGEEMRRIRNAVETADIVHVHGLWNVPATAACRTARLTGRPYVVAPHGMLTRWARRRSRWKKAPYWAVLERANLTRADGLHFLNPSEAEEAGDLGLPASGFVVPNGVDPEAYARLPARESLSVMLPETSGKTVLLFLGRLHAKKGVELLMRGFAAAKRPFPALHLVIAGPDEGGHRGRLEKLAVSLGIESAVTFTGEVLGGRKAALLGGADIFALTSVDEGDPMAVKEALASGLPVIVTPGCRIPEVEAEGAGVVVRPHPNAVAAAILRFARDVDLRRTAGRCGRSLVRRRYVADRLGRHMLARYEAILTGRSSSGAHVNGHGGEG